MSAETQTGEPASPTESAERRITSKIVIPDHIGRILILVRSQQEDTRQGDPDLAGGKFDAKRGDKHPRDTAFNDATEELPGIVIADLIPITPPGGIVRQREDGSMSESHLFGAEAWFPDGKIVTSHEHEDTTFWYPRGLVPLLRLQPKWREAIMSPTGGAVIEELAGRAALRLEAYPQQLHAVAASS